MEKLIELLNEYIPEGWSIEHGGKSVFYEGLNYNDRIIGKDFGFIKWLVDNDKIDFDKAMKLGIPCFVWYDKGEIISVHDVDFYKQLLMLLSISDSPIDFLIQILK